MATSLVVGATAVWSAVAGWRSAGRDDDRTAVDRAVLAMLAVAMLAVLLGVPLLIGGDRPADVLHLLYGGAGLVVLPVAIWLGARTDSANRVRVRRDLWTAGGAIVMLAIGLRLFATG